MYLTRSHDAVSFSRPEKLGTGTWPLTGCPMDGGGLAAEGGKVVSAWRRESMLFLAEAGKGEQQIGSGKDVALAMSGERVRAIWTNGTKIEWWSGGKTSVLSETGAFPAILALPGGEALAAWEADGVIQTHILQ